MAIERTYRCVVNKCIDTEHIKSASGLDGVTAAVDTTYLPVVTLSIPDGATPYQLDAIDASMVTRGFERLT
jgi:hypothetical protein